MWQRWCFDLDGISRSDLPTSQYDAHDTRDPDIIAFTVSEAQEGHQTVLELLDLSTRIPQARQFDNRIGS